jgi:hypothetical protein
MHKLLTIVLIYFKVLSDKIPIDNAALTELMNRPIIIRIVSILDITSLSLLEILEYGLTMKEINYSMANGVIAYDKPSRGHEEELSALGIPPSPDYYYDFLNSKVKLTELGLFILESVKGGQLSQQSSVPDQQYSSDADPRHTSMI